MQYKFHNLGELAAYFEIQAARSEESAEQVTPHRLRQGQIAQRKAEAYAFRQCAYILRNTVIEE